MIDAKLLMTKARTKLLLNHPFFGHLVMGMNFVELYKIGKFNTAATDGKTIWYNPDYIEQIYKENPEYVQSILTHEVLHAVFSHIGRKGHRDKDIWNYACDFVVNSTIVESGLQIHPDWLYNVKYKNWTSEEVYDDLLKNSKLITSPNCIGALADHHYGDDDFPGETMSEEEKEINEKEMKDKVVKAANSAGASNVPNSIKILIDSFINPKIKWHQILRKYISEYTKSDYTWLRPNKRHFGSGIILPSMKKQEKIKLAIAIDTSGSIADDDIKAFMSEINNIVSMFDEYEIDAAYFDTEIHSPTKICNGVDFKNFCENIKGRGGTVFDVWWNWFNDLKNADKTNAIIFFTDGYPYGQWVPSDMTYTNIFWVVKGSRNVGPVGVTIHYDDE